MDAVIYIRWSSAEQGKGSSLERQREDCLALAKAKGWNVVATIIDDGVSAFKGRHASSGALAGFVADVEAGAYPDGVVLLTGAVAQIGVWGDSTGESGVIAGLDEQTRSTEIQDHELAGL